jgi:hypothetical protein
MLIESFCMVCVCMLLFSCVCAMEGLGTNEPYDDTLQLVVIHCLDGSARDHREGDGVQGDVALEGADPDERRGAYLSWCPESSCDGVDMDNPDRKRGAYLSWCPKLSCNGVGLLSKRRGKGGIRVEPVVVGPRAEALTHCTSELSRGVHREYGFTSTSHMVGKLMRRGESGES